MISPAPRSSAGSTSPTSDLFVRPPRCRVGPPLAGAWYGTLPFCLLAAAKSNGVTGAARIRLCLVRGGRKQCRPVARLLGSLRQLATQPDPLVSPGRVWCRSKLCSPSSSSSPSSTASPSARASSVLNSARSARRSIPLARSSSPTPICAALASGMASSTPTRRRGWRRPARPEDDERRHGDRLGVDHRRQEWFSVCW